jgi:hypothetical protein
MRRFFINIYADEEGRYISGSDYETYQEAFDSRDELESYIETVEIIRQENILVH